MHWGVFNSFTGRSCEAEILFLWILRIRCRLTRFCCELTHLQLDGLLTRLNLSLDCIFRAWPKQNKDLYLFHLLCKQKTNNFGKLVCAIAPAGTDSPPPTSARVLGSDVFSLTLWVLRLISIKFLLEISMLYKTKWSWELRTWSQKISPTDTSTTSPHYFHRKPIGVTNENLNSDIRV